MTAFAAVLLAGGQSRRMGRDKALLPLADGSLLWQRQLAVLRKLAPAELYISGPARAGFPADVPVLADETPGLGPLAGIAAALGAMSVPRLVVLAVDMPMMSAAYLRQLLRGGSDEQGVVPQHAATGFYEPLAAVYPRGCLPLAVTQLREQDRSLQSFVRRAGPLLATSVNTPADEILFTNWNESPVEGKIVL